ncbi:hypothetical protein [Novosphingobium huizhouense]|uniref:hypothetical protein n=1 Tax=Novosphingobium huizhouense TaxID=2866625 RepID=UPI001CD8CC68|nr:hypothetical protein [Novosphingobium huizhouense]
MSAKKHRSSSLAFTLVAVTLAAAPVGAWAKETRSGSSLPAPKPPVPAAAHGGAAKELPKHVGPKKGWPRNHGIENAWQHANEHSAHHRNDSDG